MNDLVFFRNSARECRRLACRAANDRVRRELLLWAKQFDSVADETMTGEPADRALPAMVTSMFRRSHQREAAD